MWKTCGYASKTKAGWHVKFKIGNPNTLLYAPKEPLKELLVRKNGWVKIHRWVKGRLKADGYIGWSRGKTVLVLKVKGLQQLWVVDPQELLEVATARRPWARVYEREVRS